MKILFITLILIICSSCAHDAQETKASTNPDVKVELLTSVDNCKIYRFEDCGTKHYFADCLHSTTAMDRVPVGKSSRPEEISTYEGDQ